MTSSITAVAEQIRNVTNINLSPIDDGESVVLPPTMNNSATSVLKEFIELNPHMRHCCIQSRNIVFPDSFAEIAHTIITNVVIEAVPRIEAASTYFEHVTNDADGLIHVGLSVRGNWNSPLFQDLVSLSAEHSFLNHLVELLGGNEQLDFSMRSYSEDRWEYEVVYSPSQKNSGDDPIR